MTDQHRPAGDRPYQTAEHFLQVPCIPEDWGGDGSGRMNLSGRSTAISKDYQPRQYQFFDCNVVSEEQGWRMPGMPEEVISVKRRLLSWHGCGASTSRIWLPPGFKAPSGFFSADLSSS